MPSWAEAELHHDAAALERARAGVEREMAVAASDPHRPVYHFLPEARWINDPNGAFYEDGWYHVFYQLNPYGNQWDHIHWGHARSRDNVTWERLPIAVWPSVEKGEDHCYSGCAVRDGNGELQMWYTSVSKVRAKDKEKGKLALVFNGQVMLKPMDKDYIKWGKTTADPVNVPNLLNNIDGYGWDNYVRDPAFFNAGGRTFMLLGITGKTAPIYEAANKELTQWNYRGNMCDTAWDCPQMISVGDQWIYVWSKGASPHYEVGSFDPESARFTAEKKGRLDQAENYHTISFSTDDQGQHTTYSWITGTKGKGWNNCFAIPRVMTLGADGHPVQQPVEAIRKLRGEKESVVGITGSKVLNTRSDTVEIQVGFEQIDQGRCGLHLRRSNDGKRKLTIAYENGTLDVFGTKVKVAPEGDRKKLSLRVFLDKSIMEVFINGGRKTVVRVLYPPLEDQGIEVFAAGSADAELWQMKPIWKNTAKVKSDTKPAPGVRAEKRNFDESKRFDNFESYAGTGYDQPHRPLFHFTSLKNWINDPNGLLYYDGEYHLFFQHNPLGKNWGNMTWGHAVSTDLVRWEQLPHAILPYGNGYIFSGTGVVDHNNSLGLQEGDTKTLALMYSYAVDTRARFGVLPAPKKNEYYQGIAYSTDRGRTFKLLNDGGPVIPNQGTKVDPNGTERDPKLFWHEASGKWITTLWLGDKSKGRVRFFSSTDLKNWKFESDLVRPWAWECFDLFELPVLDKDGNLPESDKLEKKWLIFDANLDYEVGSFDGNAFKAEQGKLNHKLGQWNAAQTFNNMPGDRRVIIGWLTGSQFPNKGMPFAQQLTFPAELSIRDTGDGFKMYRWPIDEIKSLYGKTWKLPADISPSEANEKLKDISLEAMDLSLEFKPDEAEDMLMKIRGSALRYDAAKKQIEVSVKPQASRPRGRKVAKKDVMKDAVNEDGTVKLRILVDRGSIEIFLNEGVTVLTHSIIHELEDTRLLFEGGGKAMIQSMEINEVTSSWK
jgi:fructan beta-fructosidase